MNVISRLVSCTVLASALVVMISCGGGNSDSVASGPTEPTEPLALSASLDRLGVETEPTPRLSSSGLPLPDDYAPFGERVKISVNPDGESVLGAPRELVAVGFGLQDKTDFFSVADNLMLADCPVNNPFCLTDISTSEIYAKPVATAPWARETVNDRLETPQTLRDVTGADTDGDGYEEVVSVYFSQAQFVISIVNLQDPTKPERLEAIPLPANVALPGDIRVGAGNVDEDFPEEIVVAVTSIPSLGGRTQSSLIVLDVQAGSLDVIAVKEFSSTVDNSSQFSVLQIGNIDYDARAEIVLILNESINNGSRYVHAAARFFIFDDATAGFTQLLADNPSVTSADGTFVPQVIDAAIGDLNRDGVAEILFGGVVALTEDQSCGQAQDSTGADVQVLHYTLAAYEYNGISINKTRVAYSTDGDILYPAGCSESGAGENYIRFLDVNILDFDGDRDAEIQANQFIFDTLPTVIVHRVKRVVVP